MGKKSKEDQPVDDEQPKAEKVKKSKRKAEASDEPVVEVKKKKAKSEVPAVEEAAEGEAVEAVEAVPHKIYVAVIAKPLADGKLCKKVLKLAKSGAKRKQIKRGVKEVVKALRKNVKGICILAGDISPIDVLTHIPVLCEDKDVPYIYVPSKEELGAAGLTKRPTSCMLVLPKPVKGGSDDAESKEFLEAYEDLAKRVKAVQPLF